MIIAVAMAELTLIATSDFAPVFTSVAKSVLTPFAASVIAVVIAEGALKVITMLLEATLLTHLTTLGFSLHGSAGGTVFAEATVKHDIFAELAFQRDSRLSFCPMVLYKPNRSGEEMRSP